MPAIGHLMKLSNYSNQAIKKGKLFGSIFATFGSIVPPALYVADVTLDLPALLNITTNELEDWIQLYNQNLVWANNHEDKDSEAFLAKIIGSKESPEGVVFNQNTQHSRNRQLGIQLIGKTRFDRRRERRDTDSEVSPYEIAMVSAGGGRGKLNYERLTEWNNHIHVIEWEGSESLDTNGSQQTQQRGVIAVSFLPSNKLTKITERLNKWDSINVQDIDIKDVLKETVSIDYSFENDKLNSSGIGPTLVKVSGLGSNQAQGQQLVQEILNNIDWVQRPWYKGEALKDEGQWDSEEAEIPVSDKYYIGTKDNQQIELTREGINKFFKIEKFKVEKDEKIVIKTKESEQEEIVIENNDLSVQFLINRRNMNITRRVIKILFEQERLENIETIDSITSYSDLESAIKRKMILDKFKKLGSACSGNLTETGGGWQTFTLSSDNGGDGEELDDDENGDEELEGDEEEGEEDSLDDFSWPESKFCDQYSYPEVGDFDDVETKLAEVVWAEFKKEIEKELTKLRNLLKKEILTHLSTTQDPKDLFISTENIEKINQACPKDNNSCNIKPATVTKYKLKKGQEQLSEHIKANLTYLPDKFGLLKSRHQNTSFTFTSGGTKIEDLVPIIWSNQSFSQTTDESGRKVWSLNQDKQEGSKGQIKVTKIKEWK